MSPIGSDTGSWSRQRWGVVVLAVFVLHFVVLFLVSSRQERIQRRTESRASVRWLTNPAGAWRMIDALLLTDPTQFAFVHSSGFSGAAWLRTQSPEYRPAEWTEAERSLAQPTQLLGGVFRQTATTGEQPVFDSARKPAVVPPVLAVPQPALRYRSQLLVEGAARLRPLVQPPTLKSWPHSDVLADTRVQLSVTPDGLVFSPRLAGSTSAKDSKQREADLHAVELTRQLRFEPAAKNSRASVEGVLVFQWHTTEPSVPTKP